MQLVLVVTPDQSHRTHESPTVVIAVSHDHLDDVSGLSPTPAVAVPVRRRVRIFEAGRLGRVSDQAQLGQGFAVL